jgi:hypothetical protein
MEEALMANALEQAHLLRWRLIRQDIVYNPAFGIPTYWRGHPEIGSPLGPELDMGGGVTAQAFTGAILRYTPGVGVEVVTE